MKIRQLSPFTRDAIARTVVHVEDRQRQAPTFDGRVLHIARIQNEGHVLHELAHWVCSKAHHRELPNYGLGPDPDGGPFTEIFHTSDARTGRVDPEVLAYLARLVNEDAERFREIIQQSLSYQEELASVVTIVLMRRAGLPWAKEMRRVFGRVGERFWGLVAELAERGVDLDDPLAPHRARTEARVERALKRLGYL